MLSIELRPRYGNKHPGMDVRVNVDSGGTLSPGQRLGVEVSLMPGYDVDKCKSDAFTLCIYTIPTRHLERKKGGYLYDVHVHTRKGGGTRETSYVSCAHYKV